jgi:hypothetical protein
VSAGHVLHTVVSRFEECGIDVVPVKGVVTARTLYEDIAVRHSGDIDLRIRRKDFRRAIRVARASGWSPTTDTPILWQSVLSVMGCEVDIESTIGPPGLCAVSVDDVLRRARRDRSLFGFSLRRIEIHDHGLVLVLNVFKDGFRSLPWSLEDLRRIVTAPGFEAGTLMERAREGRVTSVLWLVADWLAREHGVPEWRVVRDRIGARAPSRRVALLQAWTRRLASPPRLGLLATATSSDAPSLATVGLGLAIAGVFRGRVKRALRSISGRAPLVGGPR